MSKFKLSESDIESNDSIDYVSEIEMYRSEKSLSKVHSRIASKTCYSFDDKSDYFDSEFPTNSVQDTQTHLISPDANLKKQDLNKIYTKLNEIHSKLLNEYSSLKIREEALNQRENELNNKNGFNLDQIKIKYNQEIENIKEEIRKKNSENKRLSDSFRACKESNESLKNKLSEAQSKIEKVEKQNQSLKNRLTNLLKKIELSEEKIAQCVETPKNEIVPVKKHSQLNNCNQFFEPFAISVIWINETLLKERLDFNLPLNNDSNLIEKIQKLLPALCDLLINWKKLFKQYESSFMEFIYLSLIHFDFSFQNQKINLSNTFRRIGEELYKNFQNYKLNESFGDEFLNFEDSKSRLLACLIILRTLNQVDLIIQVFVQIRQDLKDEENKILFLDFNGTWTVIKWCKLANQVVLNLAIDVYLMMAIEWKLLAKFLESCSNESWFSQISILLRNSNVNSSPSVNSNCLDLKIIEKISILMQKLSKIRSNKKYFDMFSLTNIINDLLKRFGHDSEFLKMNLKSIVFNLK